MKIVIDVPDNIYDAIKSAQTIVSGQRSGKTLLQILVSSVENGTPLPKGHGRLGDLDALETEIVNGIKAGNYEEGYETFAHINDMDDCIECVKYADTIIPADKEE